MQSPNVIKVLIALEELDLPYKFNFIDLLFQDETAPEFAGMTPNKRVPVLVDHDGPNGEEVTVWESGAILFYLAEKAGRMMPKDGASRYVAMQWLMFQMAGIGPIFGQHAHYMGFAKDQAYSLSRFGTEVKRLCDVCETRLAQSRYLAGEEYGIADMATWPWLNNLGMRGVDAAEVPNLSRWVNDIASRPAVERAMRCLSEMPQRSIEEVLKDYPERMDKLLGRGAYARA